MYELSKYYLKHLVSYDPRFDSCGMHFSQSPWSHYTNTTRDYEVIIVTQNMFYLTFEYNDHEEDVVIHSGEVFIIPPGQKFHATKPSDHICLYWMHFQLTEKAVLITEEDAIQSVSDYILPLHTNLLSLDAELTLLKQLIEAKKCRMPLTILLNSYVRTILLSLATSSKQVLKERYLNINEKEKTLQNFMKIYIQHNYEHLNDLDEIASFFGYNKIYLSQFYKNCYGITIKQHITNLRLEKAKDLLLATTLKINEIALACGYEDEKYFSRIFRKRYGISPHLFRKRFDTFG